jgi:ATP-dependent DNA helicase RecG
MAYAQKGDKPHLWESLSDFDLLKSANLFGKDQNSDKEGMNLAGILLLGSEQLIASVLPHHKTDAILRIENLDRYDDRDTIYSNLVESFDRLMAFIEKHLNDPFYTEGNQRISIRNKIFREVSSNLLIHREFSSAFPAKLIIEGDRVRTENANRPNGFGEIDASDFSPLPKNPIISKVFREIGLADELGSGVRNVNKYMEIYSGENPQFVEGNIFKLLLPLGKNSSNKASNQLGDQLGDQLSDRLGDLDVKERILVLCIDPKSKKELCEYFGYSDLTYFTRKHLKPLIVSGKLAYTIPDKPNSKNQKYVTEQ